MPAASLMLTASPVLTESPVPAASPSSPRSIPCPRSILRSSPRPGAAAGSHEGELSPFLPFSWAACGAAPASPRVPVAPGSPQLCCPQPVPAALGTPEDVSPSAHPLCVCPLGRQEPGQGRSAAPGEPVSTHSILILSPTRAPAAAVSTPVGALRWQPCARLPGKGAQLG